MERKSSKKKSIKKSAKTKTKEEKPKESQDSPPEETPCSVKGHTTEPTERRESKVGEIKTFQVHGKTITQAERDEIRDAYNVLSKEGNGKMGMKEVRKLLQSQFMTFTDNQAIEVFHALDQDGNGEIDFEEFENYVVDNNLIKPTQEEFGAEMQDAFAMFDTDNNGYIDAKEFQGIMSMLGDKMGDEEISEMMKEADTNGDGKIDYAEFCAHMAKTL